MSRLQLLAGTRKGAFVLETDEARRSWKVRGPYLKGWEVADFQLDDRDGRGRMFAAVNHFVYGPTVQFSDDLGETWEAVEKSPSYPEESGRELKQVWCVVPGRASEPETLYAGVDEAGLFVSHDGGDTWTEIEGLTRHETRENWFPGKGGMCLHTILPDPTDSERMWVAISAVGVFRTDDGGETWRLQNTGVTPTVEDEEFEQLGRCVHRLVHDPENPEHLYQQNHAGVYRSRNGGETWERIENGLPTQFGFPMVMHPRERETLYTVPLESDEYRLTSDGKPAVYRTTNAGDSWEPLRDGLPGDSYITVLRQAMTVDEQSPAGIYFGTTGGNIFYSNDAGDSWDEIPCNLPRIFSLSTAEVS